MEQQQPLLRGSNGFGKVQLVTSKDFAEKCTKIRKKGQRKRTSDGNTINNQKKYLCVDTVRKFKGLEAEVVILINGGSSEDKSYLQFVGMSRAVSKLIVYTEQNNFS